MATVGPLGGVFLAVWNHFCLLFPRTIKAPADLIVHGEEPYNLHRRNLAINSLTVRQKTQKGQMSADRVNSEYLSSLKTTGIPFFDLLGPRVLGSQGAYEFFVF